MGANGLDLGRRAIAVDKWHRGLRDIPFLYKDRPQNRGQDAGKIQPLLGGQPAAKHLKQAVNGGIGHIV